MSDYLLQKAVLIYEFLNFMAGIPLAVIIILAGFYLMSMSLITFMRRFFSAGAAIIKGFQQQSDIKYRQQKRPRERQQKRPRERQQSRQRERQQNGVISPFQALTTALSATVGTGNIAGVATALTLGGPGAVFWMWVSAFFGTVVKYGEVVLAVKYRSEDRYGEVGGGPMYVLDYGLNQKFLAVFYAGSAAMAVFGIGNMLQANSMAGALQASFQVPPSITGLVLAFLAAIVIIGGIKRIGLLTSRIVPVMTLLYLTGCLFIIIAHRPLIPEAFALIISSAFSGTAAAGGFTGSGVAQAVRYGVTRGIFSNEAGLGTASIAHAAARTDHPGRQGWWGVAEVVIDTHIICTVTALVLLITGAWTSGHEGAAMTVEAFNRGLPGEAGEGGLIVSVSMIFFAFSTIVAASYYGERCVLYLFNRGQLLYRLAWIMMIPAGAAGSLHLVWEVAETLNLFIVIPNLISLLGLSRVIMHINQK